VKDFIAVSDFTPEQIRHFLDVAKRLKRHLKQTGKNEPVLAGKVLAMIFEKPSLRTRVTFEVAMTQLGGTSVYLSAQEIGMGKRETVPDVARNLSRWVDGVAARVFSHRTLEQLAEHASIPVISGLSDLEHPCQALADFFTLWERGMDLAKLRLGRRLAGLGLCSVAGLCREIMAFCGTCLDECLMLQPR